MVGAQRALTAIKGDTRIQRATQYIASGLQRAGCAGVVGCPTARRQKVDLAARPLAGAGPVWACQSIEHRGARSNPDLLGLGGDGPTGQRGSGAVFCWGCRDLSGVIDPADRQGPRGLLCAGLQLPWNRQRVEQMAAQLRRSCCGAARQSRHLLWPSPLDGTDLVATARTFAYLTWRPKTPIHCLIVDASGNQDIGELTTMHLLLGSCNMHVVLTAGRPAEAGGEVRGGPACSDRFSALISGMSAEG